MNIIALIIALISLHSICRQKKKGRKTSTCTSSMYRPAHILASIEEYAPFWQSIQGNHTCKIIDKDRNCAIMSYVYLTLNLLC